MLLPPGYYATAGSIAVAGKRYGILLIRKGSLFPLTHCALDNLYSARVMMSPLSGTSVGTSIGGVYLLHRRNCFSARPAATSWICSGPLPRPVSSLVTFRSRRTMAQSIFGIGPSTRKRFALSVVFPNWRFRRTEKSLSSRTLLD